MLTHILAVALAAGSVCFATVQAQTSSEKTQPSAGEQPQQPVQQPSSTSGTSDKTKPSAGRQAQQPIQQPMPSGTTDASKYQTGAGTPASNQSRQPMAPSAKTTKPGGGPTTESSGSNLGHQQMAPSPETTKRTGSPTESGRASQAQQPVGSSSFDPSQYKNKTDCLNAASAARASIDLCNSKKLR
jgi:hypothetical protein